MRRAGLRAAARPAATGRPTRYCGPNCRQAARRNRVRRAKAERLRALQLAEAAAIAARAWRHLEEDAGEVAAAVVAAAAGTSRQDLAATLAGFREAARRVEDLAVAYFDATSRACRLGAAAVP